MDELVVLAVINRSGMYQKALVNLAEAAARDSGFALEVVSADVDASRHPTEVQKDQLFDIVFGRKEFQGKKVRALLVAAAGVGVHINVPVKEALVRGIDVITLNTVVPDMDQLRAKYTERILAYVGPDQYQAGKIQGEQLKRLVPKGGLCLYITGPSAAWAPLERKRGLLEVIGEVGAGRTYDFSVIPSDWTALLATEQIATWLRTAGADNNLVAIVSQSDPMAMGAQEALEAYAKECKRPDMVKIPILGIDGCEGKASVDASRIASTIIMAPSTKEAMELLVRQERGSAVRDVMIAPKPYESAVAVRPFPRAV